nr:immunoglobulin light chain junction region [Macaca mulatta]
CLQDIQLPFTF